MTTASQDPQLALAVCRQTELQTAAQPVDQRLRCFSALGATLSERIAPLRISMAIPATCARARYLVPVVLAMLCLFGTRAMADTEPAISVDVRILDTEVLVDVDFHVSATPQEVWAVITDYNHATEFISKLEKSVILSRTADTLMVSQKGIMGWGPFSVPIETVAKIHLTPYEEIQSHLVSGNMRKSEATTRLIADASGTRVVYHLEAIPDMWMPPLIARALVEFETRARFRQVAAEILRRKALAAIKR